MGEHFFVPVFINCNALVNKVTVNHSLLFKTNSSITALPCDPLALLLLPATIATFMWRIIVCFGEYTGHAACCKLVIILQGSPQIIMYYTGISLSVSHYQSSHSCLTWKANDWMSMLLYYLMATLDE